MYICLVKISFVILKIFKIFSFVTGAKEINVPEIIETSTEYRTEPVTEQQKTEDMTQHVHIKPFRDEDIRLGDVIVHSNNDSASGLTHEKVIDSSEQIKIPESASKVLLPLVSNLSFNDFIYQTKIRNNTANVKAEDNNVEEKIAIKRIEKKNDLRAHVQYDEVTGELIGGDHPCHRECKEGEEPMICYYHFSLEWYQTMSKACYNCPYNEEDCKRLDCIPADGMSRPLNVVNRKMPGPAIEVGFFFWYFINHFLQGILYDIATDLPKSLYFMHLV